jgi:hypothetical protein
MKRFVTVRRFSLAVLAGCLLTLRVPHGLSACEPLPERAESAAQRGDVNAAVSVVVDPRIELMTIVQMLSGYEVLTKIDSDYRREVEIWFAPFREHPAVRLFAEMSRARFAYDAVPKAMLAFSDPPELKLRVELSADVVRRAGGRQKLEEFAEALRDFARQSRLSDFLAAHRATYDRVLAALRSDVENAFAPLRRYSGVDLKGCTLVAGMLVHNGGFQATIGGADGARIYAIIGAFGARDGLPVFSSGGSVAYLVHHEFSHSYVNPWVERNSATLQKYAALYEPIREAMRRQAYNNWLTVVHEHIVRAITVRLASQRSQEAGDRVLQQEEARGFKYVRPLAEKLKEYEAARNKYPALTDFFPELIKVFSEL